MIETLKRKLIIFSLLSFLESGEFELNKWIISQGTDKYFIIAVADRGYNYLPHNIADTGNIKTIRDFVRENESVFICPTTEESDELIKLGDDGKFRLQPIDQDDADNHLAFKNHNVIVGTFRKGEKPNKNVNHWL